MNWNLIKCAFGKHEFNEPIKDETEKVLKKYCINCGGVMRLVDTSKYKEYEADKQEVIDDIKDDKLSHGKQKLDLLLKKLGY